MSGKTHTFHRVRPMMEKSEDGNSSIELNNSNIKTLTIFENTNLDLKHFRTL